MPSASSSNPVYVFYTCCASSVSDNRIAVITPTSSADSNDRAYLNGGKIAVHKDPSNGSTYIYVSTGGTDFDPNWSQDLSNHSPVATITNGYYGYILRFTTTGNPAGATVFSGTPVYACGVRNSLGFDFHPNGALYVGDNGNEAKTSVGTSAFPWNDALDRVQPGGGSAEGYGYGNGTGQGICANSTQAVALLGGLPPATLDASTDLAPSGAIFYIGSAIPQLQNTLLVDFEYAGFDVYQYNVDEYVPSFLNGAGQLVINPSSLATLGTGVVQEPTDLVEGPDGCVYVSFGADTSTGTTPQFIYRYKAAGRTCQKKKKHSAAI